ncbi:CRISPR-associated protein Csx19 [Picosynechococcus sp. NKBG15041c]|uniref:type III-D CRISPR-associated protein Csx19 n=1 Tax=Picosynechococcus sp. NKBG15041c TaxID=1407650 RepID=UPI0003FC733E|nr:CRISPR-associated protein Csx19 [Picosynechococcus sp. NKBG15041c]
MSNQTTPVTLYRYVSSKELTLGEAIAAGVDYLQGAIALLYSPQAFKIAQLIGNRLQGSEGQIPEDLDSVFEARIFNEQCELRWLNQSLGYGQVVFLSEQNLILNGFQAHDPLSSEAIEQWYLLWGEKVKNQPQAIGWLRLAEARIGRLDVPFPENLAQDQRLYLRTQEYLAVNDQFGNYSIIEERLLTLEAK